MDGRGKQGTEETQLSTQATTDKKSTSKEITMEE